MKKNILVLTMAIAVSCLYITACSADNQATGAAEATSNADTTAATTTVVTPTAATTTAVTDETTAAIAAGTTASSDISEDTADAKEEGITSALMTFSTTDLDGNPVDQSIWADYDLTMVNIWATWCGPCVGEMPELAKVYNSINQKANMVSICIDGSDDPETARSILSDSDADFMTMVSSDTLDNQLLRYVAAIPTTVFVDSTGRMVGEPIVGARSEEEYNKEIGDRLLLEE